MLLSKKRRYMQKADFEKNVQGKMQELRFQPSQEVWTRIESGLEKRKRRAPVFLWLLGTVIVLAGGTYFFIPSSPDKNFANNKQQPGQTIAAKQNDQANPPKQSEVNPKPSLLESSSATPDSRTNSRQKETQRATTVSSRSSFRSLQQRGERKNKTALLLTKEENSLVASSLEDNSTISQRELRNTFPLAVQQNAVSSNDFDRRIDGSSGVAMNESTSQTKTAPPLKKTNWHFGISASAGVSDLGKQLFLGPTAAGLSYYPQNGSTGSVSPGRPSDVSSGATFTIGGYAMKSLGTKWKIGTGIYYQYLSNSVKVGEKIDSTVFLNQNNYAMDRVNGYYKSNGNSPYHNKYHFITIPVTVQWQFAKRLSWENQFIYAYMVNTNALHYDGANRAYYENKSLFNNHQLAYSTSVLFAFHKKKIQVGPQVFYAFSDLLKSNNGDPKHLRSISIKSTIELWKN